MDYKTRTDYLTGYVPNMTLGSGYFRSGSRDAYVCAEDINPHNSQVPTSSLPNGGILLDVWPTGRDTVTDRISLASSPYPHNMFLPCHQEKTVLHGGAQSFGEYRICSMITKPLDPPRLYTFVPTFSGLNAVWYQSALWNYSDGKRIEPSERAVRQAAESALLNLWAGRPRRHMNVALALIELRDVKQTLTQFVNFSKWGINLLRGRVQLPAHIVSTLGRPGLIALSCRKTAEAYLWYTFGVRPTVDDVTRFIKECSRGKIKVRGRKRKPLLIGRTYGNGFHVEAPDIASAIPELPATKQVILDRDVKSTPYHGPDYKCYIEDIPNNYSGYTVVKYYGKVFAKVRAQGQWTWKYFPSSMAWSCPLGRTAWELVPFSFVVDWFLDVGKSIQRLDDLSWVATTRFAFEEPWIWIRKVETHYAPVTQSTSQIDISDIVPKKSNISPSISFHVRKHTQATYHYAIERTKITFDRMSCSEYGLTYASLWNGLIPEWQGQLKAYQITSGMALLESVFHLI